MFMLCGVAAVVLYFLFGVPDKARQFAQGSVNSAVRAEVTAVAKGAQSGGINPAQMQAIKANGAK